MAYTTIDNPELYFQCKNYVGSSSAQSITLDGSENMQPDFIWFKNREASGRHQLYDSVRSATKLINSDDDDAEQTVSYFTSFDSNGFTIPSGSSALNGGSQNIIAWNWSAGGSAPAITYVVKVVSDSGNKYRFDDFGTSAVTLDLQEGGTYTFDQSDSSNATHPLRFYTAADKSGGEYTTGVTTTGTPGSSGAKTVITVAASAPTLYYQCSSHAGMGGQANTNSTFGSSNFSGSIQSTVSAGITQGMSIVSWEGTGSAATIGHSLSAVPTMIMVKNRDQADSWYVYNVANGNTHSIILDTNSAKVGAYTDNWNNTTPTSSVFSVGGSHATSGGSGEKMIAYVFTDIQGYSKVSGTYSGNGNADGTFCWCGFAPSFVMVKKTSEAREWMIWDNKRDTFNPAKTVLHPDGTSAEDASTSYEMIDILSNGFKLRQSDTDTNQSGGTYIFMAFAEAPFVNSKGVPNNAR